MAGEEGVERRTGFGGCVDQEGFLQLEIDVEDGGGGRLLVLDEDDLPGIFAEACEGGVEKCGVLVGPLQDRGGLLEKSVGEGGVTAVESDFGVTEGGLASEDGGGGCVAEGIQKRKRAVGVVQFKLPLGKHQQAALAELVPRGKLAQALEQQPGFAPRGGRLDPVQAQRAGVKGKSRPL